MSEEVSKERLDSMMKKVEGLLAKADNPASTPEEADSCRATAERIMLKYKIEEEDLRARGELVGNQFDVMFKPVKIYHVGSDFMTAYTRLAAYATNHCDVQCVWQGYEDGERVLVFVGYESDIRYAETLFMQARLLFADRMEPKVDPNLSDMENVYRLRSSGLERRKVAEMLGWVKGGGKVTRLYKQACEARGEDPDLTGQVNLNDFRESYSEHFTSEFWTRLNRAKNAVDTEGAGLVLHGRSERVKEAMYQRWPELRPSTTPARTGVTPARYRGPTKAEQRAQERKMFGAGGRAGAAAGRKAAAEIKINTGTPRKRLDERN